MLLSLLGAPVLFLGAAWFLGQTIVSNTSVTIGVAISIVAFAHILLILDCLAGLSLRRYYFGPQGFLNWILGWFKGEFGLFRCFTLALGNCYNDGERKYEDIYHKQELWALEANMAQNRLLLNNRNGRLEFHPGTSYRFIAVYILVDLIHTSCLIAWMFALNSYLEQANNGYALVAAAVSCGVIYTLLDEPVFSTNTFHRMICKNLYAYKVSHLFRKLFFSVILIAGIVGLTYLKTFSF